MFLFREAALSDEDAIFELARHLNSLNLPPERPYIRELLQRSLASFRGSPDFDPTRRFLFVLESPTGEVVGTSMIHAQHGTTDEPHVFFRVIPEERYADLRVVPNAEVHDVHMTHTMLYLGQTYDGPTEIGGLVLRPELRHHPEKLGRLLSLARFVFIARHRGWFRDRLLAELLPPLVQGPGDTTRSPLWDALGHKFTGLSYDEADRLSRFNKEFIWRLFPTMPIHACLLPEGVQDIIGQVGPNTVGARRLLESIGFQYSGRVDPFDGGPHYEADTDQVTLVRDTRAYQPVVGTPDPSAQAGIVAVTHDRAPHFRAVWAPAQAVLTPGDVPESPHQVIVGRAALERLGVLAPGRDEPVPEARVLVAVRPQRRFSDRVASVPPSARSPRGSLRRS
ncbi:MAG TPA: arginine N-succinyltransferase [Nannocystis sp.]